MKTALPADINTVYDAVKFINDLVRNREDFHPDDDPREIYVVTDESRRTGHVAEEDLMFTEDEAEQLVFLFDQIRILNVEPAELMVDAHRALHPEVNPSEYE